ncbi:hypothetical protein LJB71_08745 [Thermomonas sp. S9]|nr:nitrilase-related carbon-nitrogen hydrolase [Thermomonas brevis]MCR6496298.1 hypothetical protein [Thermomonas sp. S9]
MSLRIALVQADFPVGDIDGNAGRIAERIAEARDRYHADLVLFPELSRTGPVTSIALGTTHST